MNLKLVLRILSGLATIYPATKSEVLKPYLEACTHVARTKGRGHELEGMHWHSK